MLLVCQESPRPHCDALPASVQIPEERLEEAIGSVQTLAERASRAQRPVESMLCFVLANGLLYLHSGGFWCQTLWLRHSQRLAARAACASPAHRCSAIASGLEFAIAVHGIRISPHVLRCPRSGQVFMSSEKMDGVQRYWAACLQHHATTDHAGLAFLSLMLIEIGGQNDPQTISAVALWI